MKCRLCTHSTSEEYQHFLFDDNGQNTEIYEVTVQYFDAVLNIDDKHDSTGITSDIYNFSNVICNLCWGYISEFNEFQQRVLTTLHQLMSDYKSCVVEVDKDTDVDVKLENDDDLNDAIGGEIVLIVENSTNEYYNNDNDDEIEDNVKDLLQQDKIKSNDNKNEDVIEKDNDNDSEKIKNQKKTKNVKLKKEFSQSPRKLRCRKVSPKETSDSDDKSAHNNSTNKNQQNNDHETEDNIEDLLQEYKIKSKGDSYNNNEVVIEEDNVNNSEANKKKVTKESSKCPKKRKVSPNETRDYDTKSTHYNCLNSIGEINNFITELKPQLECEICKELLTNYNELRKHFKDKHQAKCFVVCCGKKIYRRYLLAEHLRIHVNPNIFKCDICDVISSSSRALSCHKRFMHGEIEMLECKVCHKHFKTQPILNRHMEIHNDGSKDFKCSDCDRCYSSAYQLKSHINKFHNEIQICEQCGKEVRGKAALNLHIIHQHGGIKPKKIPCDKCDATLASKKGLKVHQLAFHNDLLTAFICKICGKIASSITAMENHKKYVHEMERKHKCQYCDKAFKKMSNLKEHISVHTGEHLYQCYHCPLTFGNSANMHKHRKKVHPAEFALWRENRAVAPKIDLNCVNNEVLL